MRRTVAEVRRTNAVALAVFRLGLRGVTLALYLYAWGRFHEGLLPLAIGINAAHILVGALVLVLLLRRRAVEAAILLGACSDFAVMFVGAWRVTGGSDPQTGTAYFMGAFELAILFAAATLRRRWSSLLAAVACAFMAVVVVRSGIPGSGGPLILVTLLAFAVAANWAGTRLVRLAARAAVESHTSDLMRRHRDELQRFGDALREAQSRAETLTQLIVHDLRNPVAVIVASLDVLREEMASRPPRPDEAQALATAREEVGRLADMIGDLLVVSRLEGGLRAQRAPLELRPLLERSARGLQPKVAEAGATLELRAPEGSAALDETLVRRAVDNLLWNAVRHVGQGDRIELSAERQDGALRLAVRNSGPPVPEALRERIFEKHVTHGARQWYNAGLGLYLCRLVAEAHGGTVTLEDRPGWNVSFELVLPD